MFESNLREKVAANKTQTYRVGENLQAEVIVGYWTSYLVRNHAVIPLRIEKRSSTQV